MNPFNTWTIPRDEDPEKILQQALDIIQQSIHDSKALDRAGVIDKTCFQGYDYSIETREKFLDKFKS